MNNKKVLIIAYYWPPAGGPGVQRWLKFVKYLPDFNIEPIVYVPENPNYPIIDESLQSEVSEAVTILKKTIDEPYKWAKLLSKNQTKTISSGIIAEEKKQSAIQKLLLYVRGNFFIPDARKNWVQPSVVFLSNYISEHKIETIITTGPPHSLHLIGMQLQEKLGVKWLADFRDPWTTIGYLNKLRLTKKSQERHKALEREVLTKANHITVTSFTTKTEFEQLTTQPISVITNGYDVEKLDSKIELDEKFTLSHIGSLLSKRNPEVLWKVLKELITEDESFAQDFQLKLIGTVSEDVIASIASFGISDYIKVEGYVSHSEAIKLQRQSQLLLLVEINSKDTQCIIPGKLFEYMAANRPILAIGPENWDVSNIIIQTNTGKCLTYDAHNSLKNVILEYYNAFKKGNLQVNAIGLQAYSRKALTEKLSQVLTQL